MEKTGDPVLDFVELLADGLKIVGVQWRMPKGFYQYPEDDQRNYVWNMMEVHEKLVGSRPKAPENIFFFLFNGPRPPITG